MKYKRKSFIGDIHNLPVSFIFIHRHAMTYYAFLKKRYPVQFHSVEVCTEYCAIFQKEIWFFIFPILLCTLHAKFLPDLRGAKVYFCRTAHQLQTHPVNKKKNQIFSTTSYLTICSYKQPTFCAYFHISFRSVQFKHTLENSKESRNERYVLCNKKQELIELT